MKRTIPIASILILALSIVSVSCTTQAEETQEPTRIENTLKSVSFWQDSLNLDPTLLQASLDRLNEAIDSIGYPDAGYQLWIIQNDTIADYRFLINGNWPNEDLYNEIHDHELYKNVMNLDEVFWKKLNMISYDRFIKVK
jgi:hypothetical protein